MEAYLDRCGVWNRQKTVCRASLFSVPVQLLFPGGDPLREIVHDGEGRVEHDGSLLRGVAEPSARGLTCRTCDCVFACLADQHQHFRSHLHGLNLKRRQRGQFILTPDDSLPALQMASNEDNDAVDDDDDVDDDDNDDNDDERARVDDDDEYGGLGGGHIMDAFNPSMLWCRADDEAGVEISDKTLIMRDGDRSVPTLGSVEVRAYDPKQGVTLTFSPAGIAFTVTVNQLALQTLHYTSIASDETHWLRLRATIMQASAQTLWCALLVRSGKFAGCIMDVNTGQVVAHKVFRHYTVRAKAGGSQSSHDNKGMKAQSAGATMRRAGEQQLREDIAKLLCVWEQHIDLCSTILVSAPKVMRSYLFRSPGDGESKSPLLDAKNPRLKGVPFIVTNITYDECRSVLWKCSSVWFTRRDFAKTGLESVSSTASLLSSRDQKQTSDIFCDIDESLAESEKLITAMRRERCAEKQRRRKTQMARLNELSLVTTVEEDLFDCNLELRWMMILASWLRSGNEERVLTVLYFLRWLDFRHNRQGAEVEGMDGRPQAIKMSEAESLEDFKALVVACPELESDSNFVLNGALALDAMLSVRERGPEKGCVGTLLHIAAETGCSVAIYQLLLAGARPGITDSRGHTSYFLCKNKDSRDSFRRARAILETCPADKENWDSAGVGKALFPDEEALTLAAQKEKDKEKKKRAKERKREKERAERVAESEIISRQEHLAAQLYQEALERKMTLGNCAAGQCGRELGDKGVAVIEVFGARVCSAACALMYRREALAAAAEKRLGRGDK